MAREAWKVIARRRVKEGTDRCARAHGPICEVLGHLGSPDDVADAAAWRGWLQRAEDTLAEASADLATTASFIAAARLFALRRAPAPQRPTDDPDPASPPAPAAPPNPTDDLDISVADEMLRLGLDELKRAGACAAAACDDVALCCGHLSAVRLLLDHPHLPGVERSIEDHRASAWRDVNNARKSEQESTKLAGWALLTPEPALDRTLIKVLWF